MPRSKIKLFVATIALVTIAINFNLCFAFDLPFGTNAINLVKSGVLELDNTVTVGNALDNYKYITSKKWNEFEDQQKRKIVEFRGNINTRKCFDDYSNKVSAVDPDAAYVAMIKSDKSVMSLMSTVNAELVIQFAVNVDMKGFKIAYGGFEFGGDSATSTTDTTKDVFTAVYNNTPLVTPAVYILANKQRLVSENSSKLKPTTNDDGKLDKNKLNQPGDPSKPKPALQPSLTKGDTQLKGVFTLSTNARRQGYVDTYDAKSGKISPETLCFCETVGFYEEDEASCKIFKEVLKYDGKSIVLHGSLITYTNKFGDESSCFNVTSFSK